jgi:hypothetical protein
MDNGVRLSTHHAKKQRGNHQPGTIYPRPLSSSTTLKRRRAPDDASRAGVEARHNDLSSCTHDERRADRPAPPLAPRAERFASPQVVIEEAV